MMDCAVHDWTLPARASSDRTALAMLFERHRHFVYRAAWGILSEDQAADDVVQEVFLRMQAGRLKATPQAKFTTWLYKVVVNTAREAARGRRRMWGDAQATLALEHTADQSADPGRVETREDLALVLAALPIRQREVVILRFLEGFDTQETAEILGCRAGTVKAHLHRATLKLRDILKPKGETT